jgi:hypothetical protein
VAGTVPVHETLQAGVELRGRAEGPLEGPLGEWTFSEVVARTRNARVESLAIDSVEVSCDRGSLSSLPIAATVTAGPDQATVKGVIRWTGSLELELQGRVQAEVLSPYLRLLPKPPGLELAGVRAEGTFRWSEGSAAFDGVVDGGPGSWEGRTWESLRIDGAVSKTGILARELLLTGTEVGPILRGKGSLEGDRLQAELEAGPDRATLQARLPSSGDVEGEFSLDGPCLWLSALGASLPPWASPLHVRGKGARRGEDASASLTLKGGAGWSWASDLAVRHRGEDWTVTVAAGAVSLPDGRSIRHDAFSLVGKAGRVQLPDLRVSSTNPPVRTRLSSQVDWDDRGTRARLEAGELEVQGIHLDGLQVAADLPPGQGSATVDARWGREEGPAVRISGRLGRDSDLHVFLRAPDLSDPFIRTLVKGPPLLGSVTAGLRFQGSVDQPEISGTLSLQGLTMGGLKPVNLLVAVTTEERRRIRVWCDEATPYGALRIDGRMDLPGSEPKPRLDLNASLRVEDLTPFLQKVDPGTLPWIPPGTATVEAHLKGPLDSLSGWVEGTFQSVGYHPPPPLGPVSGLHLAARLDESGLQITSLEGRLGGGAFQGKGLWELWKEDRPLAIHVTGDELLVVDDVLARIRAKPDVTLRYSTARGLSLSGNVEVPLALYHREMGGSDLGTPQRRGVVPLEARAPRLRLIPLPEGGFRIPGIPGLEDLSLDLQFKTTGEFLIENSLIGIQLNAEGQIRGTGAVPALSGTVTSVPRRGEIRIGPGAFIRIESAQLILPGTAGKEGSIRFEGRIGSGQDQITILISGPPEHATLTLISDPPKDQRELLATLAQSAALGTLTSQLSGADDWPSATRTEGFFSRIAPTVIPGESGVHQRTPWELPAAGTTKGTLVRTEYLYNQYFSILAETNHAATLAGDLKFRIRF